MTCVWENFTPISPDWVFLAGTPLGFFDVESGRVGGAWLQADEGTQAQVFLQRSFDIERSRVVAGMRAKVEFDWDALLDFLFTDNFYGQSLTFALGYKISGNALTIGSTAYENRAGSPTSNYAAHVQSTTHTDTFGAGLGWDRGTTHYLTAGVDASGNAVASSDQFGPYTHAYTIPAGFVSGGITYVTVTVTVNILMDWPIGASDDATPNPGEAWLRTVDLVDDAGITVVDCPAEPCSCLPFTNCPNLELVDDFERGVSGWGTASNGNPWSLTSNTLPSYYTAFVDSQGLVDTPGYAASGPVATLALTQTFSVDTDLYIDIGPDVVNSKPNAHDLVSIFLLNTGNGADAVLSLTFNGPGNAMFPGDTQLDLSYQDGSGNTGGAASVIIGDMQTSDLLTRVRLQIGTGGVRAKVYHRTSSEPAAWDITSDGIFTTALVTDLGMGPLQLGVVMDYTPDGMIGDPPVTYYNRVDNIYIGDACTDAYPTANQPIQDEFVDKWDGFSTIYATRYPYNAQSLEVEAAGEGVDVDPTDYRSGTFTLLDTSGMASGDEIRATYLRAQYL